MKYGNLPISLGIHEAKISEMFFYQYLPIKLAGQIIPGYESRLKSFDLIIGSICCHFIGTYGLNKYKDSNIYITAKHLFQQPNCEFNRPGWHSDGFMTEDINYIWCNNNPTTFNNSDFNLTLDHEISIKEMDSQAFPCNNIRYQENELLMLNQFNIHKVTAITEPCMRAFLKVSFSTEKYNLIGNSHNELLNYDWEMKPRKTERNHPISK